MTDSMIQDTHSDSVTSFPSLGKLEYVEFNHSNSGLFANLPSSMPGMMPRALYSVSTLATGAIALSS